MLSKIGGRPRVERFPSVLGTINLYLLFQFTYLIVSTCRIHCHQRRLIGHGDCGLPSHYTLYPQTPGKIVCMQPRVKFKLSEPADRHWYFISTLVFLSYHPNPTRISLEPRLHNWPIKMDRWAEKMGVLKPSYGFSDQQASLIPTERIDV